ncbi:unnamed protein product [Ilex paraguariensis]|uniref:Uncharacterized protein n=1 Tax=Ilex paraguariensis TaxID=185542 RepID=A0ABC8THQ3_9AQUA
MDKNKNRTDLLAAGRKKLQQFRQKKDSSGSKSSGKNSKSESEATADSSSAADKPIVVPQNLPVGERLVHNSDAGSIDTSASDLFDYTVAADIDIATVDSTGVPVLRKAGIAETTSTATLELPLEESGVGGAVLDHSVGKGYEVYSSVAVEYGSTHVGHPEDASVTPPETSETVAFEGKSINVGMPVHVHLLPSPNITSQVGAIAFEVERAHGEDQEADGLASKQGDRGSGVEHEGDNGTLLIGPEDSTEAHTGTASGNTSMEDATGEAGYVSGSTGAINEVEEILKVDRHSVLAQPLPESDGSAAASPEVTVQQGEEVALGSSNEDISKMASTVGGGINTERVQDDVGYKAVDVDRSLMSMSHGNERSLESKMFCLSSGADVSSISLSQLAEVLRGLDEDEFMFLFMSREPPTSKLISAKSLDAPASGSFHVLDRLKEQLYLTNFEKDTSHVELAGQIELQMELHHQHQQLVDEISMASASPNEVQGKNESLGEELAQYKSQLQVVAGEREELQKQFDILKAETQEFTARVDELQTKLERSQGDLSSLSIELTDCQDLVTALQLKNENLNGSLTSVTEERTKLVEEKEHLVLENGKLTTEFVECKASLASLQLENDNLSGNLAILMEERRKLAEDKEYFFSSNDKLLNDLEECRALVEARQVEITNLNGILTSVMEERKKLEEEKGYSVHETEKLSTEVMSCEGLVEALRVEIADANGNLALVTEERNKLREERKYFVSENDKLLTELAHCNGLIAGLQVECGKTVDDLKEAVLHLEQVTEENVFLKSNLDLHKAKLSEFDNWQTKLLSRSEEPGNQVEGSGVPSMSHGSATDDDGSHQIPWSGGTENLFPVPEKPTADCHAERELWHLKLDVSDDSFGLVVLKRHVEEAEKVIMKLEKAIDGMHSHSASLSRSSSKAVAPGVSKLIEAFESKAHTEDHDLEDFCLAENQSATDPYMLGKEQTRYLRTVFKELVLEAENASKLLKGEGNSKTSTDVAFMECKSHCEALKEHSNNLEEANIELVVLYEATKQHVCDIEAKECELVDLYEALRQQNIVLKAENSQLGKKLGDFQARITELQIQLGEVHRSSDQMASSIYSQVETLHKELADRVSKLEQEWNSTVAWIVETVGKLDASIETFSSSSLSTGVHQGLNVGDCVAASVDAACKVIKDLQEKLEAARHDHETMCCLYNEMSERFNDLQGKNELGFGMLHNIRSNIRKLVNASRGLKEESEIDIHNEKLLDPLHPSNFDSLMKQLETLLAEKLQLESLNSKLSSELAARSRDIDELTKRCLSSDAILKLIEDVECVVELEGIEINTDEPASRLESLISFLVQKYRETDEQVSLSREESGIKGMQLSELHEQVDHLSFLIVHHENENLILKETLSTAKEYCVAVCSELQEKITEFEQSEQRVSSLREKLSIAVTKGKGLIVQRESLKQSLAETSSELERHLQDLQSKDAKLLELEAKLKTYSEAGERVEALESELSYIRNSATALRESFLLKDSVIQRIEEILEDLELPENFHSRDTIEKVDWLARSVAGNSVPFTDWDQKSSVGGGSYSDAGFVVMDAWKEDAQLNLNPGDDFRRKYEELQSKFYGLAEQNEMLEQSLLERNNLVQQWEEILDRIDMPSQLRSTEPEDRIEWLGGALSEAQSHCKSLQQKIDSFENFCGSLTADLEESQSRITVLEAALQSQISEKDHLSESLQILTQDWDNLSQKAAQFEVENDKLHYEIRTVQEKLDEKLRAEEHIFHIEGEIRKLQDLVCDALKDTGTEDLTFVSGSAEYLEKLLKKLIEKYTTLSVEKPVLGVAFDEHDTEKADVIHNDKRTRDLGDAEEQDVEALKRKLEEALGDLMHVKEERDRFMENNQSLVREVEALDIKRQELQEFLNQEEQKSASVREKLMVAVRKGKSLVQQRDSMKQTIEEVESELRHMKSEIELRDNTLSEYEQKVKDLSTYQERVEALESESLFLRKRLAETEHHMQENGHTLSMFLNALGDIDVGFEFNIHDPVDKLKQLGKLCHDFHAAVASSEHESRKSKRASELLLAELNEVQERNDGLQEELAKAASELSELSKERETAEAARREVLARLEKLSAVHSEERNYQYAELMVLKSVVEQFREGFLNIKNLLGDVLSKDLELMHNLEAAMKLCLKPNDASDGVGLSFVGVPGGIVSTNSETKEKLLSMDPLPDYKMQEQVADNFATELCSFIGHHLQGFTSEIGTLREKLCRHSHSSHEEANRIYEVVGIVYREMNSQKESAESMKREMMRLESNDMEKDREMVVLHRNISLLYEACTSSLIEIDLWKAQLAGNGLAAGALGINFESPTSFDQGNSLGRALPFSEDSVSTMAHNLLLAIKDFINMQAEIGEAGQKGMKTAISNLQKELQEKDIQRDRICMELVNQIKEAEATAKSYLEDLQLAKAQVLDLERRVHEVEEERIMLEQRVKELQDQEATSVDLQGRVKSLTDAVASKEQEIEALMQALDEEEAQMEDLTDKIGKVERDLQQKNLDLENLEASRGKAMKKLSVTVNKFDELHHLCANLLSEVEKLQSQLQDRDAEISFLRQEVTRCTNDALVASQISSNRNSDEIHDLLTWLDTMISRVQVLDVHIDDKNTNQVHEYKEILQKQITSVISELEDLRVVAQNRDTLLQVERSRVEELTRKEEFLENSLREKASQLTMLRGVGDPGQATSITSEIMEVEPVVCY